MFQFFLGAAPSRAPRIRTAAGADIRLLGVGGRVTRRPLLRPGVSRPVQPGRRIAGQDAQELLAFDPLPVRRPHLLRPDPVAPVAGALGSRRSTLAELPLWGLARGRTWRRPLLRPDIDVCTPTNTSDLAGSPVVESLAALGGIQIARLDATTADEILVQFRSVHAGWFHQLYLGRTLVDRTWLPEQRTLVGKLSGADWPEPMQVLAVHPDVADQDFGEKLPPRPYNRVRLAWRASGFPTDTAFFDVTAGNEPLAETDPNNRLNRILYNGDVGYEYLTDPLAGSGYWNFEVTARDDRPGPTDGNAGTAVCARERVLAFPPDVEPQSETSRFGLSLSGGIATFTATLPE